MTRGPYKSRKREAIICRAEQMRQAGQHVNKSRIARELHVPLRTVFRVLPRISTI